MFKRLLCIVFIVDIRTSLCAIEALYEAGQQVWKLYTIIDNRGLNISHDAQGIENLSNDPIIREMKKQVDEIDKQLDDLEEFMGPKKIRDAIKSWRLGALTIRDIDTMELFIQNIDESYKKFKQYRSERCCSYASFEILMERIFQTLERDIGIIRKFATNEDKSLWNEEDLIATIAGYVFANGAEICGAPQVISNIVVQLFGMIIIAELKTSTMLAYENLYGYVKNKDKEVWRRINSLARTKLEMQFAIYINIFSINMAVMDGISNRACDPPGGNWIRDESFYEMEKTFHTVIFGFNWSNCRSKSCNSIMTGEFRQCLPSFYEKPCFRSHEDTIAECAHLNRIRACVLKNGSYRFHYVESAELGFLGRNSSCPDNGGYIESSIRATGTYSACVCNSYSSHNKISLLLIESDMESDRVITGLRFVRIKETLWIQPREGVLEFNGYINHYSQRWIPIPKNINSSLTEPINQKNRVFFLDDLTLPASYVLTGVKFNKVTRGSVSGFAIEIFGTQFDYKTGQLILGDDFMQSQKRSNEESGTRLSFNPVSSVFTTLPHTVTPSDIKYVSLERSTLKEDFGQSTLPLFDAVPITFVEPSALRGVGMFHKGVEGYSGLISLRVYGINYREYFDEFKLSHIIDDRVLFNSSFNSM